MSNKTTGTNRPTTVLLSVDNREWLRGSFKNINSGINKLVEFARGRYVSACTACSGYGYVFSDTKDVDGNTKQKESEVRS